MVVLMDAILRARSAGGGSSIGSREQDAKSNKMGSAIRIAQIYTAIAAGMTLLHPPRCLLQPEDALQPR